MRRDVTLPSVPLGEHGRCADLSKQIHSLKKMCKIGTEMDDWQSGISRGLLKIHDFHCEMGNACRSKCQPLEPNDYCAFS